MYKDLDNQLFFHKTAEKLSKMANMLRKLCKIEDFSRVNEGVALRQISFKVYNCEGLILRTLESSEFCQFESLKIAKNSAKISEFFN